jgi:phage replication O-like protein O
VSKLIPNTTQFPNVLLEEVAPILSAASLRVLIVIVRKTYGFHKRADQISFHQLQQLTGLSRVSVNEGLKGLGPLLKIRPGLKNSPTLEGVTSYEINLDVPVEELVKKLYQYKKFTSKENTLELVKKVYSSKETTKENTDVFSSSIVLRVISRLNALSGRKHRADSKAVTKYLRARLKKGATEADCLAVLEDRWRRWGDNEKMVEHFNPSTLFREENFARYLAEANATSGDRDNVAEWRKVTFING